MSRASFFRLGPCVFGFGGVLLSTIQIIDTIIMSNSSDDSLNEKCCFTNKNLIVNFMVHAQHTTMMKHTSTGIWHRKPMGLLVLLVLGDEVLVAVLVAVI